jgi:hypothetical protein
MRPTVIPNIVWFQVSPLARPSNAIPFLHSTLNEAKVGSADIPRRLRENVSSSLRVEIDHIQKQL